MKPKRLSITKTSSSSSLIHHSYHHHLITLILLILIFMATVMIIECRTKKSSSSLASSASTSSLNQIKSSIPGKSINRNKSSKLKTIQLKLSQSITSKKASSSNGSKNKIKSNLKSSTKSTKSSATPAPPTPASIASSINVNSRNSSDSNRSKFSLIKIADALKNLNSTQISNIIMNSIIKSRIKRMPYKLPAGARKINLGKKFKKKFKCKKDKNGFFADVDNDCKVFHTCNTANNAGNRTEVLQHSFICNDGHVFDQSLFTCQRKDDAIPCDASEMFFDLNERLGKDGPFLTDADLERAKNARPEY